MGLLLKLYENDECLIGNEILIRVVDVRGKSARIIIEAGNELKIKRDGLIRRLFEEKGYRYCGLNRIGQSTWRLGLLGDLRTTLEVVKELGGLC